MDRLETKCKAEQDTRCFTHYLRVWEREILGKRFRAHLSPWFEQMHYPCQEQNYYLGVNDPSS